MDEKEKKDCPIEFSKGVLKTCTCGHHNTEKLMEEAREEAEKEYTLPPMYPENYKEYEKMNACQEALIKGAQFIINQLNKQVCKDCYYAGFDKCQHVKERLTKLKERKTK